MSPNASYLDAIESMVNTPEQDHRMRIERDWEAGFAAYPFVKRLAENPEQAPGITRHLVCAWHFYPKKDPQRDVILSCLPLLDKNTLLSLILEEKPTACQRPELLEFVADNLPSNTLEQINLAYATHWIHNISKNVPPPDYKNFWALQYLALNFIQTDQGARALLESHPLGPPALRRIQAQHIQEALPFVVQTLNPDWPWQETNWAAVECLIELGQNETLMTAVQENWLDPDARAYAIRRLTEIVEDISTLEKELKGTELDWLIARLAQRADASTLDLIRQTVQNPPSPHDSDQAHETYLTALVTLIDHQIPISSDLARTCLNLYNNRFTAFALMRSTARNLLIVALHGSPTEGLLFAEMMIKRQTRYTEKPYDSGITLDQPALNTANPDTVKAFLIAVAKEMLYLTGQQKKQALVLADLLLSRPHPALIGTLAPHVSRYGNRGKIAALHAACRAARPWPSE